MKILVTGAFKYTEQQLLELKTIGDELIYIQDEREKLNMDVSNGLFLYHNIEEFSNLKYIQVTSAGLDRLPMEYINSKQIQIFNARGVYSVPIAEWTILKILEVYKKSKVFYRQQEMHLWEKQRDIIELAGKKACIIGYGSIGQEIAKRLKAFEVHVMAVDINKPDMKYVDEYYSVANIDMALQSCDVNIVSLPLTQQTENCINKNRIKVMKDNSILVNISRGKIIQEQDLIQELDNGKFMGVILDVFQEEPLPKNSKLWKYNNVITTPHNCFVSDKNNERMFQLIKNNLIKVKEK